MPELRSRLRLAAFEVRPDVSGRGLGAIAASEAVVGVSWPTGQQYDQADRGPTRAPPAHGRFPARDARWGEDEQATEQETEATEFEPLELLARDDDSLHEILRGVPFS